MSGNELLISALRHLERRDAANFPNVPSRYVLYVAEASPTSGSRGSLLHLRDHATMTDAMNLLSAHRLGLSRARFGQTRRGDAA